MPSPKPKPRSKNDLLYRPLSEELAYLEESHTFDGNERLYSPGIAKPEEVPTPLVTSTPPVESASTIVPSPLVIPSHGHSFTQVKIYPGVDTTPPVDINPLLITAPTEITTPREIATPPITLAPLDTPTTEEEAIPPVDYMYWDRFAIRKAKLVQDGVTRAQFALYEHLWRKGQGTTETDFVDSPAGWGRLAKELRMSDKTIKLNMQQLVLKLVAEMVREEDRYANTPRVYRVWSMRKILERWAQAGMVYVKANSGVQFLTPDEVRNYAQQGRLPRERPPRMFPPKATTSRRAPGVETSTAPGERTSTRPLVVSSMGPGVNSSTPPIENIILEKLTPSSSSSEPDRLIVAGELGKHIHILGTTDDAYVDRLIQQCRRRSREVPAAMIAWIISTKIRKATKDNIQDAAAYLATSVEGMFSGVSYDIARQEWERNDQQQRDARAREKSFERATALEFVQNVFKYPVDASHEQQQLAQTYVRDYGFTDSEIGVASAVERPALKVNRA